MKKNIFILLVSFLSLTPALTSAHAFGQQYILPLPVWLYTFGGGAAIIVSFLLIGYFATQPNPKSLQACIELSRWKFFSFFAKPVSLAIFKLIGLVLFIITLTSGIWGSQLPSWNFATNFFWIIFLLGGTYLMALVGDVWEVVNPWKTIALGLGHSKVFQYPSRLGYLPALAFYFFLIWLELLSGGTGAAPQNLSMYLLWYTAITIGGSSLFGIKDWFYFGDVFSVFFRLISKLSPIAYAEGKIKLRWPLVGLLEGTAEHFSLLLFIILMLSSTAYDGFKETFRAYEFISALSFIHSYQNKQLILFFDIFLLFLFIYLIAIWLMKQIVKSDISIKDIALIFAFSLIPIALAYNLAHYFTLFLVQGQQIIPAISDPFNLGWNLFGTSQYAMNVGIMGAKAIWQMQLVFILVGHISAVYIAHILALRTFGARKDAVLSQLPMLAVMVCYTMIGLWILAQPLILP
ncbi:MAG TPA: hypothetical protein VF974_05685 [Patescibacteria group bacterium]